VCSNKSDAKKGNKSCTFLFPSEWHSTDLILLFVIRGLLAPL
jgi:hypothetical protein